MEKEHAMRTAKRTFPVVLAALVLGLVATGRPTHATEAPAAQVATVGTIQRLARFPSQFVAPHDVDVWLPPDYPKHAPYAVLYMFDGQNLFGEREAGKLPSWQADATAAKLMREGKVEVRRGRGRPPKLPKDTDTLALERDLSNLLGLKVSITFSSAGGDVRIEYKTLDQLDDVLRRLKKPVGSLEQ